MAKGELRKALLGQECYQTRFQRVNEAASERRMARLRQAGALASARRAGVSRPDCQGRAKLP